MTERLSLSIFTIEADRHPIFAVQCRKHSEAETFLADEGLRDQLGLVRSEGKPHCDDLSIFRIRLSRQDERTKYYENAASLLTSNGHLATLLVKLDDPS